MREGRDEVLGQANAGNRHTPRHWASASPLFPTSGRLSFVLGHSTRSGPTADLSEPLRPLSASESGTSMQRHMKLFY